MKQNQLGENITRFRKEKGLSQEKVAEYMGVSRQAVTKWESNSSKPSSDNYPYQFYPNQILLLV